jgi:hypothetical protein
VADRQHPGQRQAARLRHHVLLGNTALDESVGEPLLELQQAGVQHQVGIQRHDGRVVGGGGHQRLCVGWHHPLDLAGGRPLRERQALQGQIGLPSHTEEPVGRGDQLVGHALVDIRRGRAAMKLVQAVGRSHRRVLGKRDAAPLDRVRHDDLRLALLGTNGCQGALEVRQVMAIAAGYRPAIRLQLADEIAQAADPLDQSVRLDLVVIDDDGNLVEAVVGRALERLPELTLLQLAIAGQDVDLASPTHQSIGLHEALRL